MPSLADLVRMGKQYVSDALPGGSLNPEVNRQGILDGAALSTTAVPVLGDLLGLGADLNRYATDPESRTAGNFALSGLGMLPFVPNMAGMFIGKNAKTWDAVSMGKAQEMAKSGADPRAIWKETGTWQGPDGHWRQEIPDNQALFNTSTIGGRKIENDLTHGMGGVDLGPAANLMEHPRLNAAYDSSIAPSSYVENSRTMLGGDKGMFNGDSVTLYAPAAAADAKSTLLHELQHAIQTKEGWAPGGSSQMAYQDPQAFKILAELRKKMGSAMPVEQYAKEAWGSATVTPEIAADYAKSYLPSIKKIPREVDISAQQTAAQEYYKRLAGEAESRATQTRMNMDAAQRRNVFPADSYDVPLDQLIIKDGNGMRSLKDLIPK